MIPAAFKPTRVAKIPGMVSRAAVHVHQDDANAAQIQEQEDGVTFNVWTNPSSYDFTIGPELIIGKYSLLAHRAPLERDQDE